MGQLKEQPPVTEQDLKASLFGGPAKEVVAKGRSIGQWFKDEMEYRRNAISGIDHMFLKFTGGSQNFNPVCVSLCTLAEELQFEGLITAWENMISRYPRYRQKLTNMNRRVHTARLVDVENFNVRDYFTVERLPDGANGKRELEDAVSEFNARGWDFEKPLWEAKLIHNYTDSEGAKSALIVRAHHTLADGQGYILSQLTTCTSSPTEPLEKSVKSEAQLKEEFLKRSGMWKEPSTKRVSPVVKYAKVAQKFVGQLLFLIFALLYGLLWVVYVNYMFITFRPKALLYDGPRVKEKEYAFSDKISIADIKLCQKAFKSKGRKITLNDVMCAVVVRAITNYCKEVGEPIDDRISLFVPLSTRMPWDMTMGNFSTVVAAYFKSAENLSRQQLIDAAHDEMNLLKRNIWPRINFKLLGWCNNLPMFFPGDGLITKLLTNGHGLFTNVPGPSAPIYQDGVEIKRWLALPPQPGKGTLSIGMITYNGSLSWTILADKSGGNKTDIARKLADEFIKTFNQFLDEALTITKGE
jgi:NRPS condensation-like uncharacterized protein